MSLVLTQRVAGTSSGVSRPMSSCQTQALRAGASAPNPSRSSQTAQGSSPAGTRFAAEQVVVPMLSCPSNNNARVGGKDDNEATGAAPPSPSASATTILQPVQQSSTVSSTSAVNSAAPGGALGRPPVQQQLQLAELALSGQGLVAATAAPVTAVATVPPFPMPALQPLQQDSDLLESSGDVPNDAGGVGGATTFIPLMRAPPSPTHSSAPCSPASSAMFSCGACRSSFRLTSSSGIDSSGIFAFSSNTLGLAAAATSASVSGSTAGAAGNGSDSGCPLVKALLGPSDAFRQCFSELAAAPPSIQNRAAAAPALTLRPAPAAVTEPPASPRQQSHLLHAGKACAAAAAAPPSRDSGDIQHATEPAVAVESFSPAKPATDAAVPPLSMFAAASASGCSSRRSSLRDQNSVTIKATTVVKDAAGAIDKILARGVTALVTALRSGAPPYNTPYDSLNQAVKAIAVARQYAKETGPEGAEVTFLPFLRYDSNERPDPCRFAFLVFPVPYLDERLKTVDETVLNVARGSDAHKMASAIIAVMLDRGQAVMKAAGSEAIFVAMSAVVNARHRLIMKHGFDLMLAAAWITEDTVSIMGRESKFLRFNILKTEPAGPKSCVAPSLPALAEA